MTAPIPNPQGRMGSLAFTLTMAMAFSGFMLNSSQLFQSPEQRLPAQHLQRQQWGSWDSEPSGSLVPNLCDVFWLAGVGAGRWQESVETSPHWLCETPDTRRYL